MALSKTYPVGDPVVLSAHSVCVSLPTMADVCGYEEKDPKVVNAMRSGYPRFREHDFIADLRRHFRERHDLKSQHLLALVSAKAAEELLQFLKLENGVIYNEEGFTVLHFDGDATVEKKARAFLQHTGTMISSRQAEDWLVSKGYLPATQYEDLYEGDALKHVRGSLSPWFNEAESGDIVLASSGMNAFYATYRAVSTVQQAQGRDVWIQLGWLYLDTSCILNKFATDPGKVKTIYEVTDLDALEAYLKENGAQVAGIVTEVPTNPLIQTVDLPRLKKLAEEYGIVLVIDPTISSAFNLNVLPYADVVTSSLTKYTAAEGDVMIGTVVLNRHSGFYAELRPQVVEAVSVPYARDLKRLAVEIDRYTEVLSTVNSNTCKVARFLESHPAVSEVFWAYREETAEEYKNLANRAEAPGGIITFYLKGELARFYDRSNIVKSPSFGAKFTMMCPFMYLAHYDLVVDPQERARLEAVGVDPELIRLSVGVEPVEDIIADLEKALS